MQTKPIMPQKRRVCQQSKSLPAYQLGKSADDSGWYRPDEMSDETKIGRELTMIMLMKRKPDGFGAIPTKRRKDRKPSKCLSTSNYLEEKTGSLRNVCITTKRRKDRKPGKSNYLEEKPGHFETCALVYKIER
jgi:hypothetical protein